MILLPLMLSAVITNAPMAKTIWIAATNYGTHKGTKANPLDGSTTEKFDDLLRKLPPHTTINLGAGVFTTSGSASYNAEKGWWVKAGWKVKGQGENTIVRQSTYPEDAIGVWHGTFESDLYCAGGVTISDLVVDENWPAFGVPSNTCTFAVSVRGDNCTIRNVKAINGHGDIASLLESFELTISHRYGANGWEINTNGLIEGCTVSDYTGNYGVAIALMPTVKGKVRDCIVKDFYGTAPFGISSGVTYSSNLMVNCHGGFYTDTGTITNVHIVGNRMLRTQGLAIHINPIMDSPMVRDVVIDGNQIEASQIGVALSGPLGPGYQFNFTIKRNSFHYPHDPVGQPAAIVAAYVDGLNVTDNAVDEHLVSVLEWPEYPSKNVRAKGNRLLIVPNGLEDR